MRCPSGFSLLCAIATLFGFMTDALAGGGVYGLFLPGDPRRNSVFVPDELLDSVVVARVIHREQSTTTYSREWSSVTTLVDIEVVDYVVGSGPRLRTVESAGGILVKDGWAFGVGCSECIPIRTGSVVLLILRRHIGTLWRPDDDRYQTATPRISFARMPASPEAAMDENCLKPLGYVSVPVAALWKSPGVVDIDLAEVTSESEEVSIAEWVRRIREYYGASVSGEGDR